MTEPSSLSLEPPRGMRDFYPDAMNARNAIFSAWTRAARRYGFAQYDACVVESLDLLKRKSGEEIVEQIYAFQDKSGRDLALRPEMTPTLARMIAARQGEWTLPLKWFAIAQCFRYERMSRGRKREHYQWNLDIVGEETVSAEAEVIACALQALANVGLTFADVRVHFSSRALLKELLAKAGIPESFHPATFLALDKRGKLEEPAIARLLKEAGLDDKAIESVFGLSRIQTLDDAAVYLGGESASVVSIRTFLESMTGYGFRDQLHFDLSVVRGLGYYTGIVFEAFDAEKKFRAIFGGGRYDRLLADIGGKPISAVGLGFGDVVIAELLVEKGRLPTEWPSIDVAVGFMEDAQRPAALRAARAFREAGSDVDLALRAEKPKHFFARVGRGHIGRAIYIGPDDVQRGIVRVKNLKDRTEVERPIDAVAGG